MKDETLTEIAAQIDALHFAQDLPAELDGFTIEKIFAPVDDKFIFFTCRIRGNA